MRYSIDMDGTLWSHMRFFRGFMENMQAAGHEVGILTGHSQATMIDDFRLMQARGFPRPDFFYGKETALEMGRNGAYHKAEKIISRDIAIHFDDCDYANPETLRLFRELLGSQFYRVALVKHREPVTEHFE